MKKVLNNKSLILGTLVLGMGIIFACTDSQAKAKINLVTKDGGKPGVAAKIGGVEISDEELVGEAKQEFFELKKREYDLKMERLNRILEDKLIGAEAKKANMPTDQYIEKKVIGKITIGDSEYKQFVKDRKIPEEQLKQHPEYKQRITQFLEGQKKQDKVQEYLAKLTKSSPVEVYFKKPEMERVKVEVSDSDATKGKKGAKVQIVEFSDFQCPYCSRGADAVNELAKKYGSKVSITFKHYPLPFHPNAKPAAEVALCVKKLGGDDKFWKYHDVVFKNQEKMDAESLLKYAKDVGADQAKTKECVDKGEFKAQIEKDMEYGNKIGVRSTPTFFINGQLVAGALPIEQFSEMIDEELKK